MIDIIRSYLYAMKKLHRGRGAVGIYPTMGYLLASILWGVYFLRATWIILFQQQHIESFVPDDAFYYLELARNRSVLGIWSMDGMNIASGFHLFWGYFLYLLNIVLGVKVSLLTIFGIGAAINSTLVAIAFYLLLRVCERHWGRWSSILILSFFLSPMIMRITTNLMESSLYIFAASALVFHLWGNESPNLPWILFFVVLGVLTRVDFVILPVMFSLGALIFKRIRFWNFVRVNLVLLLSVLLYLLHNYLVFGHLIQRSAQIKEFLSKIEGPSSIRVSYLNVNLFFPYIWQETPRIIFKVLLLLVIILILLSVRKFPIFPKLSNGQLGLMFSSISSFFLYFALYRYNSSGLQPWYAANFLVIGSLAIVGLIAIFPSKVSRLVTSISLSLMLLFSLPISFAPIWPNQLILKQASTFMNDRYPGIKYAAWNSGILSFNSVSPVTNLDGLVNDRIYSYVTSYRTYDFIQDQNIRFIVDFDETLREIYFEPKGMRDPRWDNCIKLNRVISTGASGESISLFNVKKSCS